jgi:hypothetical protein
MNGLLHCDGQMEAEQSWSASTLEDAVERRTADGLELEVWLRWCRTKKIGCGGERATKRIKEIQHSISRTLQYVPTVVR